MAQETAQLRIERALASKRGLAQEQLELEPDHLVDFWRKPATKGESGWRGPATVLSIETRFGESSPVTMRWQGQGLSVRSQDLRRALVYIMWLTFVA